MGQNSVKRDLTIANSKLLADLLGTNNINLTSIEESLNIEISDVRGTLLLEGNVTQVEYGIKVLNALLEVLQSGIKITQADVMSAIKMVKKGTIEYFSELYSREIIKDTKGHSIRVKNFNQKQYINAINNNDITFGIGPAGTGKTYLSVAMAVVALKKGTVSRLIFTRPAVEAGENLGFLPGDFKDKVDPYLRPIYDALYSIMGSDHTNRLMERGVIEIAPLAYMRGRTLDEAFIILDEAQNTTQEQMKMFLTRFGFGSKMVVNGDISQIDLPTHSKSGLIQAQSILKDLKHIEFVNFTSDDVVRHHVVAEIVEAYDKNKKAKGEK